MLKARTIFCLAVMCVFTFAGTAIAQVTDLSVIVMDSQDPTAPDSTVNFAVEVANAGPDDSPNAIILDIYMPMDVPVPWQEYLDADADARAAIVDAFAISANILIDENIWDEGVSGTYIGDSFNNACESMIIQPQDLIVLAGTSGQVAYDATLPESGGVSGLAWDPALGDRVVVSYGVGGCNTTLSDDCAGIPCMGPRLTMHPTTGAPITIGDDGTGTTNDGCEPLVGFPAGHIALIDRGLCNFSLKADHATQAGASGVIIANTVALGTVTPTGDSVMTMGCTDPECDSSIITIPAGFISYNAGEALKAAMVAGGVSVYMGVRPENSEYKQTKAYIWESSTTADPTDIDPDNDHYTETTSLAAIFIDGFESGDTLAW